MSLSLVNLYRQAVTFVVALVVLLAPVHAALASANGSLTLTVYADGYVAISQTFPASRNATSIQVPLLSTEVSDLVATDQNGSPLSYSFSSGGSNVTVYTLGATEATLHYDTDNLTAKAGTVWSLAFDSGYNSTLVLPELSTLVSITGTPYTINQTSGLPELTLSAGAWTVRYGVPFTVESNTTSVSNGTTVTTQGGTTASGGKGVASSSFSVVAGVVAVVVIGGAAILWWRRHRSPPVGGDLRPDDVRVLDFIRERGGKVLEPEIRTKFALPKTSAWRQIKRLERLGYVKVTKIGSQNQIEIVREKGAGAQGAMG